HGGGQGDRPGRAPGRTREYDDEGADERREPERGEQGQRRHSTPPVSIAATIRAAPRSMYRAYERVRPDCSRRTRAATAPTADATPSAAPETTARSTTAVPATAACPGRMNRASLTR